MIRFSSADKMSSSTLQQVTAQSFWAITRSVKVAWLEYDIRCLMVEIAGCDMPEVPEMPAPYVLGGKPSAITLKESKDIEKGVIEYMKKEEEAGRIEGKSEAEIHILKLKKRKDLLKRLLPGFVPHALMGKNRSMDGVQHVSGMVMIDIDHCDDIDEQVGMLKSRVDELGILYIGVSISGDGIRVFFLCPDGMTIEQAQIWFCEQVGVERDGQCIDIARFSFAVSEKNIKYIREDMLFEGEVIQPWCDDAEIMTERVCGSKTSGEKIQEQKDSKKVKEHKGSPSRNALIAELEQIPFNKESKVGGVDCQTIWDKYFKETYGCLPGPANRHDPIGKGIIQLAYLFGSDARKMMECTPRYGISDHELAALMVDKLNWTRTNPSYAGASNKVKSMLNGVMKENRNVWEHSPYPTIEEAEALWSMMPRQPHWVQALLKIVPDCTKYSAFVAKCTGEMTLADRVTCKYEKFRPTDLASSCVILGYSGGFKGAPLTTVEQLMIPLKEETDKEQTRENEYIARKEAEANASQHEAAVEIEPEPVFNIRYLPNDTTKNRHIECLKSARCTFTLTPELSALYEAMKKPAYDRKSFFLLCFDRGEAGSQVKRGCGGVNDSKPCRWNFIAGTNLTTLQRVYPETTLTTGDIFRLTMVTIPNTFGHQSELYVGEYSKEDKRVIHRAGELLMACEGQTNTPRLSSAIHEWHVNKEKELMQAGDFEGLMLLGRIPLISYRIGQAIHLSWGVESIMKEEKKAGKQGDNASIDVSRFKEHRETIESALIVADNLFDTMACFFKKRLKARNQYELDLVSAANHFSGSNNYDELPDTEFTYEILRKEVWKDLSDCNIRQRICRLVKDKKVVQIAKKGKISVFQKVRM